MTIVRIATRARFVFVLTLLISGPPLAYGLGLTAGAVTPTPAPASVVWDQLQSDTQIALIQERSSAIAGANIMLDVDGTPGLYDGPDDLSPGRPVIAAGTAVDVHLLHFDPVMVPLRLSGSVTFAHQILGLAFTRATLAGSDVLGASGTEYPLAGDGPSGPFFREYELGPGPGPAADSAAISADRRTLTVDMGVTAYYDQLRVFTAVPEPGTFVVAMAALACAMLKRRATRGA